VLASPPAKARGGSYARIATGCAILAALVVLGIVAVPTVAYAGDAPGELATSVGTSASGLPGLGRVAVASPRQYPHAAAALGIGYGFTEAQTNGVSESGSHHRASGSFALMVQPLRFLAASLMLDGRYDSHPNDALGSSSSAVGEPRLFVRANEAFGRSFALGAQLGVWIPGGEAPSLRADATTVDGLLLATYAPPGSDLAIALNAGYRLDRSGQVLDAGERPRLRPGDRLSLRLSDFDAALFGIGASKRLGAEHSPARHVEALGEVTWDVLLGTNAPRAIQSPLRLGLGARYHLKEDDEYFGALQVEARTEIALGQRPSSAPTDALAPIDPRFAMIVGLRWAPALVVKVKAKPTPAGPGGGAGAGPEAPVTSSLRGRVTAEGGGAIASARVTVTSLDPASPLERAADSGADGSFTVTELRPGRARVVAKAAGYEDASVETAIVDAGATPVIVDLVLKKAIKPGQLRGLVRSFNGKPLAATIRVEPLGVEAKTDADGMFQIDVPPGSYEVVVAATGHAGQRRPVQVEENGVTILNADLRPSKDKEGP
jgi:hypothetical protein